VLGTRERLAHSDLGGARAATRLGPEPYNLSSDPYIYLSQSRRRMLTPLVGRPWPWIVSRSRLRTLCFRPRPAGFDLDSRAGFLFKTSNRFWPPTLKPVMTSPGAAQDIKNAYDVLNKVGLKPVDLVEPQKIKAFTHITVRGREGHGAVGSWGTWGLWEALGALHESLIV
jgi:hypothetical protein